MTMPTPHTKKFSHKEILHAVSILKKGGVIAHPTETCYGFACDAFNKGAVKKLYALKKMKYDKPVSIIVPDLASAEKLGHFSAHARKIAQKYWPGPLTIVVKRKKTLPSFINPSSQTIGFRVPRHTLSLKLVRALGNAITTTSANISLKPQAYSASSIRRQFRTAKIKPDYILDSGVIPERLPSTVIDFSKTKSAILRQGSLNPWHFSRLVLND